MVQGDSGWDAPPTSWATASGSASATSAGSTTRRGRCWRRGADPQRPRGAELPRQHRGDAAARPLPGHRVRHGVQLGVRERLGTVMPETAPYAAVDGDPSSAWRPPTTVGRAGSGSRSWYDHVRSLHDVTIRADADPSAFRQVRTWKVTAGGRSRTATSTLSLAMPRWASTACAPTGSGSRRWRWDPSHAGRSVVRGESDWSARGPDPRRTQGGPLGPRRLCALRAPGDPRLYRHPDRTGLRPWPAAALRGERRDRPGDRRPGGGCLDVRGIAVARADPAPSSCSQQGGGDARVVHADLRPGGLGAQRLRRLGHHLVDRGPG